VPRESKLPGCLNYCVAKILEQKDMPRGGQIVRSACQQEHPRNIGRQQESENRAANRKGDSLFQLTPLTQAISFEDWGVVNRASSKKVKIEQRRGRATPWSNLHPSCRRQAPRTGPPAVTHGQKGRHKKKKKYDSSKRKIRLPTSKRRHLEY